MGWYLGSCAQYSIYNQDDDGSRDDDEGIYSELVTHLATLCLGSYDRCIRDKRQVVAKVGSTHDDGYGQCQVSIHRVGETCRDGHESYDGSHAGAYRERYEAGSEEETG